MQNFDRLVHVISAVPLDGFKVHLTFDDGTRKEMNLAPFLRGPIFEPVQNDPQMFRRMKIEGGTIAWENGADIDPNVLRYDLKPAWLEEEQFTSEKKF